MFKRASPDGSRRATASIVAGLGLAWLAGCGDGTAAAPGKSQPTAAASPTLLHLADLAAQAQGESAPPPARTPRTWRFDQPRPEWTALPVDEQHGLVPVTQEQRPDALHLALGGEGRVQGGIVCDVEDSPLSDWSQVVVRARSKERLSGVAVSYDVSQGGTPPRFAFMMGGEGTAPVFNDGSSQDYVLPLRPRAGLTTLSDLGLFFGAPQPAGFDLLSITLVPRGADFAESRGSRPVTRDGVTRQTLYAHVPAKLSWRVKVPQGGRLDTGLACEAGDALHYTVTAGEGGPVLDESVSDGTAWKQVSADLSSLAGREVELTLVADGPPGAVALWGAPILSGREDARGPNVIFYVIDGGGADLMSLYGYNRPTTPFLERLAREGTVFEHAYSNATWTQASTASFMTSLQHSVLGGLRRGLHSTPVPASAPTMAEDMRAGGWQTAVFTTNPNCARVIGLQRGVDVMNDSEGDHDSESSSLLHQLFWDWRADYPGAPWWVHFQTTDVHEPNEPRPPYAGMFVSQAEHDQLNAWDDRLFSEAGELFGSTSIMGFYDAALAKTGIPRQPYFNTRRGLYDEDMAHQDRELQRFVEQLKASGEWGNTLLIVAADHGHPAGTFSRFGRGLFEPQPDPWQGALFDPYATRVPLLFVWPGHVPEGQRVTQPVSMIDVLPTLLELAGLPAPAVAEGRSLVPLMRGQTTSHPPVILDEFRVDEATGQFVGNLDVVDGRWGASLEIGPVPAGDDPARGRHAVPAGGRWGAVHPFFPDVPRLLLYDLWDDPWVLHAVNDQHPDLVKKYEQLLRQHWELQQALATKFRDAGDAALAPDQLKALQQLGYIR